VAVSTLDDLRRAGEALTVDVSRALHRAHAGLDAAADLRPIYARHADAVSPAALEVALGALADAARGTPRAPARALAEWQVEAQTGRALAAHDEREIAWERAAVVRTAEGRRVEYAAVAPAIANTCDRAERLALDEARAALVARELGAAAPRAPGARARRRRVDGRRGLVRRRLRAPQRRGRAGARRRVRGAAARHRRRVGRRAADVRAAAARVAPGELTRADALALFRAPEFDAYFPSGAMVATVRVQLDAMGVDPAAGGRVRYDVGERPGKRARAFCAPVRVPDEVHLVLRPQGGAGDWRTLLHEVGHALHFGHTRADLPFEFRWAGDASVTEGYAMLFDHLTHDAGWLMRQTDLGGRASSSSGVRRPSRSCTSCDATRRSCSTSCSSTPESCRGTPSPICTWRRSARRPASATVRADALVDVDPRLYAARYLEPGSCRPRSPRRCASGSTPTGGGTRAPARSSRRSCGPRGSARPPTSWRRAWPGRRCRSRP
jgi:hypothetical protein